MSTKFEDNNYEPPFDPNLIDWFADNDPAYKLFEQEWHSLLEECPTELDCIEELLNQLIAEEQPTCMCGCRSFDRRYGARKGKCRQCRRVKSFFADFEFFKGFRRPRLYLFVLRLLQKGARFSKNQVSKTAEVAYSSVWSLLTKIALAMLKSYQDCDVELNIEETDSAVYLKLFTRRSSVTPASKKPFAEQKAMEEKSANERNGGTNSSDTETADESTSENSADRTDSTAEAEPTNESAEEKSSVSNKEVPLTPVQKAVYDLIKKAPVSFDQLYENLAHMPEAAIGLIISTLTILELKDLIICLDTDRYVRREQSKPKTNAGLTLVTALTSTDLSKSATDYIRATHNGISRKYLPLYLADFCRVVNFRAGKQILKVGKILRLAAEISRAEVLAFESPLVVSTFI